MPRLLYIGDVFPAPPGGGSVLIYRHLHRLALEGWRVTVTVPAPAERPLPADHGFELRTLPGRRWWWPPARPTWPAMQWLRARLWTTALRQDPAWSEARPDAILTLLWGHASLTAAWLARAWDAPLAVVVHDLFRETALPPRLRRDGERITRKVLASAAHTWPVSDEMGEQLASLCAGTMTTLPPVPEQGATPAGGWPVRFRSAPVVAHAGAFHPHHVDYLAAVARAAAKHGGTLLVLTPADNPALAQLRATGVLLRHQPAFSSSAEALRFLATEASALTIMYPLDPAFYRHPPTGFPSRLIEFSQLGLPILLAAPSDNPATRWARRHGWNFLLDRPDWSELESLIARLADEASWRALAAQMRTLSAQACDPEKIHRQFLAELPRRRSFL